MGNEFLESLWANEWTRRGITVCAGLGVLYGVRSFLKNRRAAQLRAKWNSAGKDVVVLHQFWRGKYCPNMSPFALKVETFLRLAGIKYVVDIKKPFGTRGLVPWITLNGEDIEDSQHIVDYLSEKFNIRLDDHLSPERKATLEAVRIMLEDQMFWIGYMHRYYHTRSKEFAKTQVFPTWFLRNFFPMLLYRHSLKRGTAQGIARHTREEQMAMGRKQIVILHTLLGDRQYFGGDQPCTVDCIIFGFMCQFMFNEATSDTSKLIKEKCPSLVEYTHRMKERLYPDWKKLLYPPQA